MKTRCFNRQNLTSSTILYTLLNGNDQPELQEGLMMKAERMKKKMGLGAGGLITLDTIKVGDGDAPG